VRSRITWRPRTSALVLAGWALALLASCTVHVEPGTNDSPDAGGVRDGGGVPDGWDTLCYFRAEMGCSPPCWFCSDGDIHYCSAMNTREVTPCGAAEVCALTAEEFIYSSFVCIAPATCDNDTSRCLADGVSYAHCDEYYGESGIELGESISACDEGEVCIQDATQIRCALGAGRG
jgi:hypothetical protein